MTSGSFQANSAWLVMAAIAFNLTRASGLPRVGLPRPRDDRHGRRPTH